MLFRSMASKLEQLAFASYIADGHLERHVRKLKRDYREKSLRMEQALAQHGFSFFLNEAYLSYVVQVDADPRKLSEEAEKADIGLLPMENGTVELSFASIEQENIAAAVSRFANLVRLSKNEL